MDKDEMVPYLALGSNLDYGFLFSRRIETPMTDEELLEYMKVEAGAEIHSILIIKNDFVVREIEDI